MSYEAVHARFVDRIETIRCQKRMTKKDFCKLCGINISNYDYYVREGGMPNLYTTLLIADALGMSLDQLMGIQGGKNNGSY